MNLFLIGSLLSVIGMSLESCKVQLMVRSLKGSPVVMLNWIKLIWLEVGNTRLYSSCNRKSNSFWFSFLKGSSSSLALT